MSPKRIARPLDIYVRVSDVRGRGGDSFISPKDQEERCRALATARGYQVGDVFYDHDVSGGKMRRPELDKAIGRIGDGVSGGIIVAKLDRFARTLIGGLQTLEQIDQLGGAVIVADGEFDTSTATGELVLNMMLSLAQFELRRIRETWATSKRHAVENGIHISRHVPPGYARGDDRRLAPDREHAPALREAFAMAARGEPLARIADHLTREHVPSGGNNGARWQSYRIKRLLANRVYLGEARDGHGDINRDAHPALVDPATWNLAQRAPIGPTLTSSAENLLAGLCRCASCSFAMRSQPARGKTIGTYRCATLSVHGRCPHPTSIGKDRLEEYVLDEFLARTRSIAPLRQVEEDDATATAALVDAEESYRTALTDMDLRASIGAEDHNQLVAAARARWEELLAAAPQPPPRPASPDAVAVAELAEELRAEGNVRELRELLGSAIAVVFVRPAESRAKGRPVADRVKIVWQGEEPLELPRRGERFEPRPYEWATE